MPQLIAMVLKWMLGKLGLLLVILAILLVGARLKTEWDQHRATQGALEQQEALLDALNDHILGFEQQSQIARDEYLDLARHAQAARRAANQAKVKLDALERGYWWWDSYVSPAKLVELQAARATYAALDRTADAAEAARSRASQAAAAIRREIGKLEARQKTLLDAERSRIESNPRERLIATIKSRIPAALAILAGILLLPVAIKTLFYFVLAPLASRLGPICILPDIDPPPLARPATSAVSATVDIQPGQELLVQPDFLQSSSRPAFKRTRWFLNPRLPFASIASGMFALTSVSPEGDKPTRVVVSSQRDPFSEIGVVALPAGAAMVVHPRSLAGILKPAGGAARITRHWRLGSLHAWLTLQLRYLVFHGPCELLLKGCRGVRVEAPQPDQPRLINQAATLGFSANLEYRTIRCETFVPYLRGHEELFNDLFAGGPGWFVYEEMPARGRRTGVTGRGLEGLTDAVLKAFGI
jgi:hypothetical protein